MKKYLNFSTEKKGITLSKIAELITMELASKGFYPKNLILDGTINRFDREGHSNAWCIGFQNTTESGKHFGVIIFGDWREGSKHKFYTDGNYSELEKSEINHFVIKQQEVANQKLNEDHKKARHEAKEIWNQSYPVKIHPYLVKKQITEALGARAYPEFDSEQDLILPIVNVYGEIQGVQTIWNNGTKRFVKGLAKKGHFIILPIGFNLKDAEEIYICEGFSTGASIQMATGKPVVCALDAGNLSSVCWAIKEFSTTLKIIIAGDDDRERNPNVGREKSLLAAQEIGAKLVFPKFNADDKDLTDFNDIHVKYGISEVAMQLTKFEEVQIYVPPSVILASQFLNANKMNYEDKTRIISWRKDFFQFCGTHYQKLIESDFVNDVLKFLQKHPIVWSKAKLSLAKDVLGNIEAKVNVKSEKSMPFWISNPDLSIGDSITLKNGVVDLTDVKNISEVKLSPHCSDLLQITCLDFDFEPEAQCPEWLSFLDKMIPDIETQKALQEWFGYNLVFDTTFQKFAIFFGKGANGKTVCCTVLKTLLGSSNISAVNLEAFDPKRTFNMAMTAGKLANIVEELNVSSKAEEGELKKFVSGGLMTVERKGKDPFEMTPTARLTFVTNVLPNFSDSSDGLWRRLLLFPFNVQILDPNDQKREYVEEKFWIRSGELSGIFNWALEGLLRLRAKKGFTVSSEMREAAGNFEVESNPTREFLLDSCELSNGAELSTTELYEKYKSHMASCGYQALGTSRFANEVKLAFPNIQKSKDAKLIAGVRCRIWNKLSLKHGVGGVV